MMTTFNIQRRTFDTQPSAGRITLVLLAGLCAAVLAGCATPQMPAWVVGLSIDKGESFPIQTSTKNTARMYPSITKSPDGAIYVFSGLGISISRDGGRSWEPVPDGKTFVAGTAGDGEGIALEYFDGAKHDGDTILLEGWPIAGGVITGPLKTVPVYGVPKLSEKSVSLAHEAMTPLTFFPAGKGVRLPSGRILLPVATRFDTDHKIRCIALISDDNGASFRYLSTIAAPKDAPWGREGPNEAAVCVLQNGELLAVMRTGCDARYHAQAMVSAISRDDGETWGEHGMMSARGVAPMLLVLANGVVACTAGRPGNAVVFSADNGRTWSRDVIISNLDAGSSGYLQLVEAEPNRLLVVCEQWGVYLQKFWLWEPPPRVDGVFGIFINVERR